MKMTNSNEGPDAADPRITLMPRDPEWLYVYWDMPDACIEDGIAELGVAPDELSRALRVHDATDLADPETGELDLDKSVDYVSIDITPKDDHWYFKVGDPERTYCVEYLLLTADGRKASLAISNVAETPAASVAPATTETWVDAKQRPAEPPPGEPDPKWNKGQDNLHEALSSAGSGSVTQPEEPEAE
jgi:uncharacterized protein